MKNKAFLKLLKKTSPNSNSGFTLMELLVGLFMSIFVVGALGFGMLQVLRITQSETSKSSARNETSRAIDFISDEIRRAKKIENVATSATGFNSTDKIVVFALDIPNLPGTGNRIVYYLQSTNLGAWQGPQVLYRWGPPLDSNGEYTTGTWQYEALIDKINNTVVSSPCTTGTVTPASPTGFYACITGANTAQLYFTGVTKTVTGSPNDNYAANTQAVARVNDAPANNSEDFLNYNWSVKDLGGAYSCDNATEWEMRTDFGNDTSNLNNSTKWIRNANRQAQPITIDPDLPLILTSSAFGKTGCNSRGNEGTNNGAADLTTYTQKVSHTIDFDDPQTFNGNPATGTYNNSIVTTNGNQAVQMLKNNTVIGYDSNQDGDLDDTGDIKYGGFDANGNGNLDDPGDQPTLGKFLYEKGFAIPEGYDTATLAALDESARNALINNPATVFKVTNLTDDQRIIAFEIGQDQPTTGSPPVANPGFDLQDNIFIVTSEVFKKTFHSDCFSGSCPSPEPE